MFGCSIYPVSFGIREDAKMPRNARVTWFRRTDRHYMRTTTITAVVCSRRASALGRDLMLAALLINRQGDAI